MSDLNHIFNKSECLNHNEMTDYLSGKLSDEKMRRVEMHIADCMMCADELEGLSNMNNPNNLQLYIDQINEKIDELMGVGELRGSVSGKFKIKRIFTIAASVLLLVTGAFLIKHFYTAGTDDLAEMAVSESTVEQNEEAIMQEKETPNESVKMDSVDNGVLSAQNERTNKQKTLGQTIITPEENIVISDMSGEGERTESEDIALDNDVDFFESDHDVTSKETEEEVVSDEVTDDRKVNRELAKDKSISAGDDDGTKKGAENKLFGFKSRNIPMNQKEESEEGKHYLTIRNSAMFSFDEKVYGEASEGFNQYLEFDSNDKEVIYKNGVSYYYLNEYDKALNNFNKVLSFGQNKYYEDAEWFKSQTLLKSGKSEEASAILKKIVSKNGKYKSKAEDVLKQLN